LRRRCTQKIKALEKPSKVSPDVSQILSCDNIDASERYLDTN